MATFVLIHGMWHGGWCWKKVTTLLRSAGHEVYTPTLTGLGERAHLRTAVIDLDTHIQDVVNVFVYEDLRDAILIGHSFGGTLVSLIAEKIPNRIAHLVNLDGPFPENGKALKDLIGDTWDFLQKNAIDPTDPGQIQPIPDWTFGVSGPDLIWMQSKLTPQPIMSLTTPVTLGNPAVRAIPRTFIACTDNPLSDKEFAAEEKKFADLGWQYRSLSTGHDAMITMADALTDLLLNIAK